MPEKKCDCLICATCIAERRAMEDEAFLDDVAVDINAAEEKAERGES